MPNDASLDLLCQQYGEENHFPLSACLFPRIFCKYRFHEMIELCGRQVDDYEPSEFDILIAADWWEESDDPDGTEIAEFLRLAVEWNLEPPTMTLRAAAAEIQAMRRVYRYRVPQADIAAILEHIAEHLDDLRHGRTTAEMPTEKTF